MNKGIAVSPGVVVGVCYRIDSVFGYDEPEYLGDGETPEGERARFDRAVSSASSDLEAVVEKVSRQLSSAEADIFRSHLQILHDEVLSEKVHALILTKHYTALSALQVVLQGYASSFARMEQESFKERLADLRDVFSRIGSHLTVRGNIVGESGMEAIQQGESVILVAHEILPSQAMSLGHLAIAGIVTEVGGGTGHAAILARSRGIPAVSGVEGICRRVESGDQIIVDGREGIVIVRPNNETITAYRKLQREFFDLKDRLVLNRDKPAVSSDGTPLELLANINNLADARAAGQVGASGVGLFRTEYLFLTHPDVPDEEEQYESYRRIVEDSPNRSVTIRTLDIGGDKTMAYLGRRDEANPFMGWRSIRLMKDHPRLFEKQVRAILRAGRHGKVSMLFPMITNLDELRDVNRLVEECRRNLRREGIPFGADVKTGVMIEVPAAAVCIDTILRETDFISIGSNDLIQYLVAADRDNPKVAHLCEPLNPAIFRVIKMVVEAASRTGTPVTICGEMAGRPKSALILFGLGIRRFSMSPAFVPTIKALLGSVSISQAERFTHQVLQFKTSEEIQSYLAVRLHEISSDIELFDSK